MNVSKPKFQFSKTKINSFLVVLLFCAYTTTFAQEEDEDATESTSEWNYTIAPYLMFPNMNGDVAVNGINVDVSANPGDIFDNLDFGAMLYAEMANEGWAITFDLLYMNLGKRGETPLASRSAEVSLKQLAINFNGLRRVNSWFEAGVGFRINVIDQEVMIAPGDYILPGTDFEMTETWVDPLIVARAKTNFNGSKWKGTMLADIGGFGIGSDFAWQLKPALGYQFSDLFSVDLAYRWISMDYETGAGLDYFKYDMVISGPEIGFVFDF